MDRKTKPTHFTTLTIWRSSVEKIRALKWINPNMSVSGHMAEIIDFYEKSHCPECGERVVEFKKHHRC